jgi:hypothetical protein
MWVWIVLSLWIGLVACLWALVRVAALQDARIARERMIKTRGLR